MDIDILIEQTDDLRNYSSAGWRDYIATILGQIEALNRDRTSQDRLTWLKGIANMFEILKGKFSFYQKLKPGTPKSRDRHASLRGPDVEL
jgi:hypothetical protein